MNRGSSGCRISGNGSPNWQARAGPDPFLVRWIAEPVWARLSDHAPLAMADERPRMTRAAQDEEVECEPAGARGSGAAEAVEAVERRGLAVVTGGRHGRSRNARRPERMRGRESRAEGGGPECA